MKKDKHHKNIGQISKSNVFVSNIKFLRCVGDKNTSHLLTC